MERGMGLEFEEEFEPPHDIAGALVWPERSPSGVSFCLIHGPAYACARLVAVLPLTGLYIYRERGLFPAVFLAFRV